MFSVLEEVFDTCDDVVAEYVDHLLRSAQAAADPLAGDAGVAGGPPVTVKSINLQSFTMPEFFARCIASYPLVEFSEGDPRALLGITVSPCLGRAFNLDEGYEFWGHLDLTGKSRGDKEGAPCPIPAPGMVYLDPKSYCCCGGCSPPGPKLAIAVAPGR